MSSPAPHSASQEKEILLLDDDPATIEFTQEYFQDTAVRLTVLRTKKDLNVWTDAGKKPYLIIIHHDWTTRLTSEEFARISQGGVPVIGLGAFDQSSYPIRTVITKLLDFDAWERQLYSALTFREPIRVLMVDDEVDLCTELKEFLEMRKAPSFSLDFASNGLEGFKKLRESAPDILLLDLKMPVKSGIEFFHELTRAGMRVPTIVLSATVSSEELETIRRHRFAQFIEKGSSESSFPRLCQRIKKALAFGYRSDQ